MDEFFVVSVDSDGTATTTKHQTLHEAEKALADEKLRVDLGEIIGVGLDQKDPSGSIHALKAFMRHNNDLSENVFIDSIKEQRLQGHHQPGQ